MKSFGDIKNAINIKCRESLNPYFGPIRKLLLKKNNRQFTIISNNCWGGHVYRYYSMPYASPTIGLYLFSADYIKFIYNLEHYLGIDPVFITYQESKYRDVLVQRGGANVKCPIGVFDDIEIIFLHYQTEEEVLQKWNRRKKRIVWDNLFFKMSEQNLCNQSLLKAFDEFPIKNKVVFTSKNYGLDSQIVLSEFSEDSEVINDTNNFRRYINLTRWLNKKNNYKKRQ